MEGKESMQKMQTFSLNVREVVIFDASGHHAHQVWNDSSESSGLSTELEVIHLSGICQVYTFIQNQCKTHQ